MIIEEERQISTTQFHKGYDVTADMLNAMSQYLNREIADRTKDLMDYPGFAYGFKIGAISGQTITITAGSGFDQSGRRLYHPASKSYKIAFPSSGTGITTGYLCVKAYEKDIDYRIHPYTGERLPVETYVGLEFFIDFNTYTNSQAKIYPSDNNGLVLAKLTVSGVSYEADQINFRSPFIKMKIG
jgi:hypothetical protein